MKSLTVFRSDCKVNSEGNYFDWYLQRLGIPAKDYQKYFIIKVNMNNDKLPTLKGPVVEFDI